MTLEGTNTWLVGRRRVLVVDPGPAVADHVAAVLAEAGRDGAALGGVLLTHRHLDHAEALGLGLLQDALAGAGAPVLALDPALGTAPTPALLERATDEPAHVLPVPGHTDDSLALVLPGRRQVLTGDTVLGRGTSVVAHPDGDLGQYLGSLDALAGVVADGPVGPAGGPDGPVAGTWSGLPGHGPVVTDLAAAVRELREHRLRRVEQVRAALAGRDPAGPGPGAGAGPGPEEDLVQQVVAAVYPDLDDPVLLVAAGRTVRATLVHLGQVGA